LEARDVTGDRLLHFEETREVRPLPVRAVDRYRAPAHAGREVVRDDFRRDREERARLVDQRFRLQIAVSLTVRRLCEHVDDPRAHPIFAPRIETEVAAYGVRGLEAHAIDLFDELVR